jgi:hypothetical protein
VKPNFPASLVLSVILQVKALLADSEQSELLRRLSEANQYNQFLKRQDRLILVFSFKALFTSTQKRKIFQDSPSHRIFRHMHGVLNIDENKN